MCRIAIGIVRKTHGVKGSLRVRSFSGETEHFLKLKKVYIGDSGRHTTFNVEAVGLHSSDVLLKLKGVDTPEAGTGLNGREVWVDREQASTLKQGEYYVADLCQCLVECDGQVLGRVKSIVEGGASDLLEVERSTGTTIMVPLVTQFVAQVDLPAKRICLKEDLFDQ